MKHFKELWAKYKLWRQYKRLQAGKPHIDLTQYAGYFFPVGFAFSPLANEHLIKMTSGKVMRATLLSYKLYLDPHDMIEEANYQYIGYENEKTFKDMTWEEYHAFYYY